MDFSTTPTSVLAEKCAMQTQNYLAQRENDPRFCYELLRRALVEGASEALTHVYQIYLPLAGRWARRHPSFDLTDESAGFFASTALGNFYFALRGNSLATFETLSRVLSYLKACVHSAIMQHLRTHPIVTQPLPETGGPVAVNQQLDKHLTADELWSLVRSIVTDPDDQLLVHCRFVLDMKPAEIAEQYPSRWSTAREVSVALQRIRRWLRKDPMLRQLATGEQPESDS
ncbi:MAG: sigma-70 family RNA polymerase sigma factor [Chloroflexi bacterium]|nr:sigma-70 family RNA polymerase sigma factor [Chloroflexota bacterium]